MPTVAAVSGAALIFAPIRSRYCGSPSGPVTDFRGDPFSLIEDPLRSVSSRVVGTTRDCAESAMAKTSPFKFLQEVRTETEKVTWPTRRETAITTVMVFIMSALAAVFFLISDQIIRFVVTTILSVGS